ncbi:MAG: error-prone DNA polymerase [Candidatus Puniceispirillaceae bacterium]
MKQVLLGAISNFSFLHGASHPQEMVSTAADMGWQAIGMADYGSMAGMVRAHMAAKDAAIKLLVGASLHLTDGVDVILYARNRTGYASICQLLSQLNMSYERKAGEGASFAVAAKIADLARLCDNVVVIIQPPPQADETILPLYQKIAAIISGPLFAGGYLLRDGCDEARLAIMSWLASAAALPFVALSAALYHQSQRRPLADVLCCIRHKTTLAQAGHLLSRNAEQVIRTPQEMRRLWAAYEGALDQTEIIADLCDFSLAELSYEYPEEILSKGRSAIDELDYQTWRGAEERYPDGVPEQVQGYLRKELMLVRKLSYAPFFLTVFDIVRYARSRNILCQGRGSAANSAICYCLGITSVDPDRSEPLFERFVSEARAEPPDIDVDFEHERREEIIQYIYFKYGRHRAGLAAAIITYRGRSALREIAKVFGLSRDAQAALSSEVWGRERTEFDDKILQAAGLDPDDPNLQLILKLARQMRGFPRHLSQHVGGFVIARDRLDALCPIRPAAMPERSIIEWDKDDLEALGLLKVDVLALGMLSCIRRAFDLMTQHYQRPLTLASVPPEDVASYDMLCRGESVGVFQVESRAQMAMLPRLQPRCFHDLVVQVAIVRPGPIQGDMVHPYLRRRAGLEKVVYPSQELRSVLERTLGVPLFQEQAMKIAIVGAGFTGAEADQLRRAMATFKKNGQIEKFYDRMIKGMVARGYDEDFATRCFKQIEGFGTYGFPESHAASFALLVYISAWLKCHYPDVFICALLNAQPMGFYAPAQLVAEARRSVVPIRQIDINHSDWDNSLEPAEECDYHALRLGLRQVKGLGKGEGERLAACRHQGYASLEDVVRRADISHGALEALAKADAFTSLGLTARDAFWQLRKLEREAFHKLPLFDAVKQAANSLSGEQDNLIMPDANIGEKLVMDYGATGLSLRAHPVALLAPYFGQDGWQGCAVAAAALQGKRLSLIGLVTTRQRPGTAKGTVFVTMEDGDFSLNVIIWPKLVETYRQAVLKSRLLGVVGRIQREGRILHFIAERLEVCDDYLRHLRTASGAVLKPYKGRNFH